LTFFASDSFRPTSFLQVPRSLNFIAHHYARLGTIITTNQPLLIGCSSSSHVPGTCPVREKLNNHSVFLFTSFCNMPLIFIYILSEFPKKNYLPLNSFVLNLSSMFFNLIKWSSKLIFTIYLKITQLYKVLSSEELIHST
jgi:hypothetical protein